MSNMPDEKEQRLPKDATSMHQLPLVKLKRWKWWFLVALHIIFLLVGQAAGILLGRFYYEQGGNSKWMITLVQTAGFPLLFIPLFLLPSSENPPTSSTSPSTKLLASVYFILGGILAGETVLFSVGLSYLSASTYSLICATQIAFMAVFSRFINSQKFTALILNSVVVLLLSTAIIAVNDDSEGPKGVSKSKYVVGFICTLAASLMSALLLSLVQFSFRKVLKRETFSVVLETLIYISVVASSASVVGLFVSGEWRSLHGEMMHFAKGGLSYVMTLVWTAVAWQVCSIGAVGLIFVVSSLFSNVISTLSLAVTPIASVIAFHDKMSGIKIVAMLMAIWGFFSYIYQNYLEDSEARQTQANAMKSQDDTMG